MDSYNLSYTPGFEQQKRLSDLARRCRGINGWGVQELLQHAATANYKADIDLKLDFLEDEVSLLESQSCRQPGSSCASARRNIQPASGWRMHSVRYTALTSWSLMPAGTAL